MRVAFLDPFAGVSGDMLLAALIDAGAPVDVLEATLARLNLGAHLETRKVMRCGIQATKADIRVGAQLAEEAHAGNGHTHGYGDGHAHGLGDHDHHHDGHGHEHDHPEHRHEHSHAPTEHRPLSAIRKLIHAADLPRAVANFSLRAFDELGRAEAKIHGIAIEDVHFHEVGAVDAIADIVLVAAAVHALGVEAWHGAALNVGGGTVQCAHGRYPVPAPATAELLRGFPTYSAGVQMELVTPTGAALVRALEVRFGPAPAMRVEQIGYGAGGRDPQGFANVLRVSIGAAETNSEAGEVITVLETAVDDLNPQVTAYVMEKALALGALDVMGQPVQMKKGRAGTLITVLAPLEKAAALQDLLLRETSSLGLRIRQDRRVCLPRELISVTTAWGQVRIKVARRDGVEWNAAPEFEDCRALAERNAVPLKNVMAAAMHAYRTENPR